MQKESKIIAICGSPRNKNTAYMLKTVLDATGKNCEMIMLKDKSFKPCDACRGCYKTHKCIVKDDMQDIYDKLLKADVIILGSPTYFDNVTALMKAFIDRCLPFYLSGKLKNKKVALVSVGNFKEGEVYSDTGKNAKDYTTEKEAKESVKKCIYNMNNFCEIVGIKVIDKIIAINGDPISAKDRLIKLGKRIASL